MQKNLFVFFLILLLILEIRAFAQTNQEINSPDKSIWVKIEIGETIKYSVQFNQKEIIHPSPISMTLENGIVLGHDGKVKKSTIKEIDETIIPVVKEKREKVGNQCNELTIEFKENYSLVFRAYDDGVAYRWITNSKKDLVVVGEQSSFYLSESDSIYYPEEESFLTHSERLYPFLAVKDVTYGQMSCMPALVCKVDGTRIAITESDLLDYPGMYLTGTSANEAVLTSIFPPYPIEEEQANDRTMTVEQAADYIAKTAGQRAFPWRVMIIADDDAGLIESDMVYKLATPNKLPDFFWIEPGKVAWDWWNALNIYGVDFESGLNTDTYKFYIDFAAEYNIPYIILDEGWSNTEDLMEVNPDIDLEELFLYAHNKDVGIILWVVWLTLDRQLDVALDQFQAWGAKGIKVDFMQRDDQLMVNYYEKIAAEAAKRRLLVNFHGSYKPTGLRRTYPNVLTREGVKGLENNKWSKSITPDHDLILPFTRMLAGPMDYTPGAMINCTEDQFEPFWNRPMSQGTRCHQLAMYVIYESPMQMLADSPSNYYGEPETMEFLKDVPTTWDDTKVIKAKVGDYLIIARRKGEKWYIGAMTDWQAREFVIDFDFLSPGTHNIKIWQDGVNADKNANDFKVIEQPMPSHNRIKIKLAPGGGWAAILE